MNYCSKTITGDGLITHFNISDESINELSKRVPIIGESYRGVRHVITNDVNKYAPKKLFHEIVNEIINWCVSAVLCVRCVLFCVAGPCCSVALGALCWQLLWVFFESLILTIKLLCNAVTTKYGRQVIE